MKKINLEIINKMIIKFIHLNNQKIFNLKVRKNLHCKIAEF